MTEKNSDVRLLVIASDKEAVSKFVPHLQTYGYQVEITISVNQAMEIIKTRVPHVILLSWNLKNISVVKVYAFYTQKLNIPTLVFTEESSHRTTSSLIRSRIPHTLLPPVSAPGIHRRISALLRKKDDRKNEKGPTKHRVQSSTKHGVIRVLAEDVEPDTLWEQFGQEAEDGDISWKGIAETEEAQKNYYFKGPEKPVYDSENHRWENIDSKTPILMQERRIAKEMSATQSGRRDTKMFSLIQKSKETGEYVLTKEGSRFQDPTYKNQASRQETPTDDEEEILQKGSEIDHEILKGARPENSEMAEFQSILARCVKAALNRCGGSSKKIKQKVDHVSTLLSLTIPSHRFKGYLLTAQASDTPDREFVSNFYGELQEQMSRLGESLKSTEDIIDVKLEPFSFRDWAESEAQFLVSDSLNGEEIIFAFMDVGGFPQFTDKPLRGYVGVKFENWLLPETELLTDLYLHMPLNEKHILYLKKGSVISEATVNKFLRLDVEYVFVREEEKNLFISYCISAKISTHVRQN